ncbi:transposable element Tcb1 transposase [Trichonephila clavipes]|nr:transposable element Tcb1 transposase [Trichonephila clavipes]
MDPQPRNLAQLATALESAWLNIPENTFRDLSDSLPAGLAAVHSGKGQRRYCKICAILDFRSLHAEIVEVEIEVVSPSIVSSGNFAELNPTVTCMVLKANGRRTSCPCHDEFRGPRSDYVRQVASENNNNKKQH